MKVSYFYTKNNFKSYIIRSRRYNNLILFIIGIVIYLWFLYDKISLLYFTFYIIGLIILLTLINLIYVFCYLKLNDILNYNICGKYILELTPNKFSITINNKKTDYKYNNIKRIKNKKGYFVIKFYNTREYLVFEQKLFEQETYKDIYNYFVNKMKNLNKKS